MNYNYKKTYHYLILSILLLSPFVNWLSLENVQRASANELNNKLNDELPPEKVYFPLWLNSRIEEPEWPMVAANPARTSWTPTQVSGMLHVVWYRPIEAYISQYVQVIAANGLLYISTSKGLYALDASTGEVAWRFDTSLPLGNSPTVFNDVVYVGGFDRKLHALNALTGTHLWSYDGASAGYDTNPLVVEGKVILGNRDGSMYAIGAHGTPNQGQLIWKFKSGGPIHLSAAYRQGVIYFAADDNHAYAITSSNGALVWKSAKLPSDGYHSYWPVLYRDKVVLAASASYRNAMDPGSFSATDPNGNPYDSVGGMENGDLFWGEPPGTELGPILPPQDWSHGYPIIDASRLTEYYENKPDSNPTRHKPWRRTIIVLNASNGVEYTFDSDGDGYPEYIPIGWWGTKSGNRYPPVVGPDDMIYLNNRYDSNSDAQGKIMGWRLGTEYLSIIGGQAATAEPQALSMGGNLIYRNLCCDRVGSYTDIYEDGIRPGNLWSYSLLGQAPGYDEMWTILPGLPRLQGWYKGDTNSINGIYHNHGDQNPLVPYRGMVFSHRSNAIIAFGSGPALGKLPTLNIASGTDWSSPLSTNDLQARLEEEIEKMIAAGHLRPGYYNGSPFSNFRELADYFDNPGDTLYTLSIAYTHLNPSLQAAVKDYLQQHFSRFYDPVMYAKIGWNEGAPREAMPLPPEVEASLANFPAREYMQTFSWSYPPLNFYAMWKYALIVPEQTVHIYDLAKTRVQVPVISTADTEYFRGRPYELNAHIGGYIGFLELQELAGRSGTDAQLRTNVTNELNRLLTMRVNIFDKDTPWGQDRYNRKILNISQNFIMMVPELADYLNSHVLAEAREAVEEYEYVAPYWFVARYEAMINEGVMSPLYNYAALFQAKAYLLKESRNELTPYLDVPGFAVGDLFYLQNIVAALEAP